MLPFVPGIARSREACPWLFPRGPGLVWRPGPCQVAIAGLVEATPVDLVREEITVKVRSNVAPFLVNTEDSVEG